jgi:hypothetical protein
MSLPEDQKQINHETFTDFNDETAYLLGFIFADGFLGFHKNTGLNYLRIYSKHRYKIENIKQILQSKTEIVHIREKMNGTIKQGELFYLHVGNQEIIEDLIDLGMVERKNDKIQFPYLPSNLLPHFIRGLWSGKGSISMYKGTILSTFSIGSIDFISDLENHLHAQGLSRQKIQINKNSKKPTYKIRYSISDTKKLYDYIYSNVTDLTISQDQENLLREFFADYQFPVITVKRKMKRKMKRKK